MDNEKMNKIRFFIDKIIQFFDRVPLNTEIIDRNFENKIRRLSLSDETLSDNIEYFNLFFDLVIRNEIKSKQQLIEIFSNKIDKKRNRKIDKKAVEYHEQRFSDELYNDVFDQIDFVNRFKMSALNVYQENIYEIKSNNKLIDIDDVVFDIFLSHRQALKFLNFLLFYVLTVYEGIFVYVDWIFDNQLDRTQPSKKTINLLKKRMSQSKRFMFFNIEPVKTTNWMAWEVGFFTCMHPQGVGIFDIFGYCKGNRNVEVLSSDAVINIVNRNFYVSDFNIKLIEWINM